MSKVIKPIMLDETGQATNQKIDDLANALIGVLASVKSVNGKYGVVVLDSGDILVSKNLNGSKTVREILNELSLAVSNTPLTFSASPVSGKEDEYVLNVTTGTPQ